MILNPTSFICLFICEIFDRRYRGKSHLENSEIDVTYRFWWRMSNCVTLAVFRNSNIAPRVSSELILYFIEIMTTKCHRMNFLPNWLWLNAFEKKLQIVIPQYMMNIRVLATAIFGEFNIQSEKWSQKYRIIPVPWNCSIYD